MRVCKVIYITFNYTKVAVQAEVSKSVHFVDKQTNRLAKVLFRSDLQIFKPKLMEFWLTRLYSLDFQGSLGRVRW